MTHRPLRIAHRGASREFRENTMAAFTRALALGADGIELDVHVTSDGMVVVHHDPHVEVGGSSMAIADAPAEVVARAGDDATRIPRLDEVLDLVGDRAELFVEIKGAAIEDAVLRCLEGHTGRFAVHSFDHDAIERVARRAPHVRRGLLFDEPPVALAAHIVRAGAHDVWPRFDLATSPFIGEAHALGARVIAWTVNDPAVGAELSARGVDGLCTDDVRWFG